MTRRFALPRVAGLALASLLWLMAPAPSLAQGTTAPTLQLRWALDRNVFPADKPWGQGQAHFQLTNTGSQPLPAQGWALYFNCISGVALGEPVQGPFRFEQVTGTLYRLRPTAEFAGLAPGASTQVGFVHGEPMAKPDKAPVGPYLVLDEAPTRGHAIADFQRLPLTTPEQLYKGPNDPEPVVTPQALYRRNAHIQPVADAALPPVFPSPVRASRGAGQLHWAQPPKVLAAPGLAREAAQAQALLAPHFAAKAPVDAARPLRLVLARLPGEASPEAHRLVVDAEQGVTLTSPSAAGIALGLQSLRQLLPQRPATGGLLLPEWQIDDAPRFGYRGVMVDVARHFHPKSTVLGMLDLMARYKLNKLHFHLTDDEGWRLAIKGLPELTSVGARRGHTPDSREFLPPAYGSGPTAGEGPGSGHYTRADYVEILRYAAARHIEVIPEIEMPGHARAAVKAMASRSAQRRAAGLVGADEYLLSDPADASQYSSAQLYTDHMMDPGLDSTYAFIERVVADLAAMHREAGVPARSIHVGADEVPAGAWDKSPASLALMARLGLKTRADLWDHFYTRVDKILRKHGAVAAGWEELGAIKAKVDGTEKFVPNPLFLGQGYTLYVWNNVEGSEDLAYRLANAGYKTVLAPATRLYFDMAANKNPEEEGVNWAAYTDLDTVHDFVPFDDIRSTPTNATPRPGFTRLTPMGRQHILGLEATLFAETVRDADRFYGLFMPRLLALAERAWAADPAWANEPDPAKAQVQRDAAWSVFAHQLGHQVLPRLDLERPDVRYRIAPPGLLAEQGQVLVNHQIPGLVLRYTTDGSEPTLSSMQVSGGKIAARGRIRVAAFDSKHRRGRSSEINN